MATKHLLLGRLRRDTMVLGSSEEIADLMKQGEDAVKQGRAAEVWIIETQGYFTETDQNWEGIDSFGFSTVRAPSSVPALNPNNGDQESLATSDREGTTPRLEQQKAAQAQADSGDLVDTGYADRLHNERNPAERIVAQDNGQAPPPVSDLAAAGAQPPSSLEGGKSGDAALGNLGKPQDKPAGKAK